LCSHRKWIFDFLQVSPIKFKYQGGGVGGCWLLVACCWLLVAGCLLLVGGCWLVVAGCWLPGSAAWSERIGYLVDWLISPYVCNWLVHKFQPTNI
jgi:hypothetical protein